MKKFKINTHRHIILIMMIALVSLSAKMKEQQTNYSIADESNIMVFGTSSLHDWEMEVTEFSGVADFTIDNNSLKSIEKLETTIPVKSLKSGKSGMDNNAYEALKASKFPNIKYKLDRITNKQSSQFTAIGELTIAGVTKTMEIPVNYSVLSASKIKVKGNVSFKMSEFNIDPPTAVWGTIKTGDEVKLEFETSFVKN